MVTLQAGMMSGLQKHLGHMTELVPVIMCGGSGTRLWPLSRASYPKQYWAITGDQTLLQQTQSRLKGLPNLSGPLVICNEDHRFIVAEQLRQLAIDPLSIILEPEGKNTAPAIALAALQASRNGCDPLLLVLAADHSIKDEDSFERAVLAGISYAEGGSLVTFGIVPTSPEVGYGYIEGADKIDAMSSGSPIVRFVEKPNKTTAEEFLQSGRFTWNSGMFLFRASTILEELERYSPEILKNCRASLAKAATDLSFIRLDSGAFKSCPESSIDVAVMEKTSRGVVIPLQAGWSDIGSWSSLWDTSDKDENGNVVRGRVMQKDAKNCYLRSEKRLVVGLGIEDLVVVETDDVVLVAKQSSSQEIKNIVKTLEINNESESKAHRKIYRPWGYYDGITEGDRWQVKKISVNPGASLSLQLHNHRAEHWIVVQGTAIVEIDDKVVRLTENQSTYIPVGVKHRLSNPGKIPVEMIEVQSGAYLGEDDIVRYDDLYGR